MSAYADSSLFVSLYLRDAHFGDARRRIHSARTWLTPFQRAEWHHAIAQHVFRRFISDHEAEKLYNAFEADRKSGLWLEAETPENAMETAIKLAIKYVSRLGCRTLDTLHVASALELGADEFWTFDSRQVQLASAVGLKCP